MLSVSASTKSGTSGAPSALPTAWTADIADTASGATVQFASVGGRVTSVCAARSASTDELNIKRAVISALQLNALVFTNRRLENLEEVREDTRRTSPHHSTLYCTLSRGTATRLS